MLLFSWLLAYNNIDTIRYFKLKKCVEKSMLSWESADMFQGSLVFLQSTWVYFLSDVALLLL